MAHGHLKFAKTCICSSSSGDDASHISQRWVEFLQNDQYCPPNRYNLSDENVITVYFDGVGDIKGLSESKCHYWVVQSYTCLN